MASVSSINQLVTFWKVIKLYAGYEVEVWRLGRIFNRIRNTTLRSVFAKSMLLPVNQLLFALPFAYIIYYVVAGLSDNTLTPGTVAAFISTLLLINVPVRSIVGALAMWVEMSATAERVFQFIAQPLEQDDGRKTLDKTAGQLTFNEVSFSYPGGTPALKNVSFTIRAGEVIAVVGRSGAGKTTLANLLPRFLSPSSGSITLDGTNIADLTLASLRQQIDIVAQESFLLDDTVANNVVYPACGGYDEKKLHSALSAAAADDFVRALPHGVATVIGENGAVLSGGQRQRLVLARAFYRNAPILVLDEPTSALDSDTEQKIKTAMRRLLAGRTAIIIAHRFTTIEFADRVVVLEKGRLHAVGTVEELRKTNALFAELYDAQQLH